MARHQHAVIWTAIGGVARKMGDLVLGDQRISFTYTHPFIESGLPGMSLLGDSSLWGADTQHYPISERIAVFPRLLSLIPGNNPRNLQRRHYLDLLRARSGREPSPGRDTEWQLLLLGGHGGIGHVDVFADDLQAQDWYARQPGTVSAVQDQSQLWRMLKRDIYDENVDFDARLIERVLGPTPTVGGMIPKLLVAIDNDMKEAVFYPPGTVGKTDVVLKIEPPEYPGLLDLEALCLDCHRNAGFEAPDFSRFDNDDFRFLALRRFDRIDGKPLPMESLFSLIASGDHQFRETGDILLPELGMIFSRLRRVARLAPDSEEWLYRRILMALLTGNGDLHLDNLALLGGLRDCRLAPVYDPAPMRAWPRHNLVSAIPFDPTPFQDHGEFFVRLGKQLGLNARQARECQDDALRATADFSERVMALDSVVSRQREQLVEIADRERALLLKWLNA